MASADYPIREMDTVSEGDDQVELRAMLVPSAPEPAELGAVVRFLKRSALIEGTTWTAQTTA